MLGSPYWSVKYVQRFVKRRLIVVSIRLAIFLNIIRSNNPASLGLMRSRWMCVREALFRSVFASPSRLLGPLDLIIPVADGDCDCELILMYSVIGIRRCLTTTKNYNNSAHDSLPSPLKMKVSFEDLTGKRAEVILGLGNTIHRLTLSPSLNLQTPSGYRRVCK